MNKLKEKPVVEEEVDEPIADEATDKQRKKRNVLLDSLDVSKWISYDRLVLNLPFILFIAFIGILYIANSHYAEKSVRETDAIEKKMKQLQWEYTTTKSDLEYASKQSEVAKIVGTDGLKELNVPPQKIVTNGTGSGH